MWFSIIASIILLFISTVLFTSELRIFPMYRSFSFFFLFDALFIVANFIITEIWPNVTNMSTIHNIGYIIFGTYILISLSKYMQNIKRTQSNSIDKKESVVNTNTDKNKTKASIEDSAKKEPTKTTATKSKTTSNKKNTTTNTKKNKSAGPSANNTTKKRTTAKSTTSKTANNPVVEKEPSTTKDTGEQTVVNDTDSSI